MSYEAMIDSYVRASLGPDATERQKHIARHSLYAIVRQAIAEDRAMQRYREIDADIEQADRAMRGIKEH